MYLDPAFGGMLLQIIVVAAAVGGAVIYSLRNKIRALFTKNKKTETKAETKTADDLIDTLSDE